jgi:hypothetical protein
VAQLLILQQRLLGKNAQLFTRFGERDGAVIAHKQRLADLLPGAGSGAKAWRADVHRPLRPWRLSARCRNIFRSRKSTDSTPLFTLHKLQRDVVNISISAINFLL